MKLKQTIVLFFIIPLLSFSAHKYFLSLTQINYKTESKSIQIIINVFMDDIESAINKDFNINLQLTTENELADNNIYFEKYLKQKLFFKVNDIQKDFNYIGKEYDGDLIFFYLEIENINSLETINVTNDILTTHFPRQQNLVKLKVDKTQKSKFLTKHENSTIFKLE
ncbi:MAG: hypothetical protein P8P88_06710 [Polaribacter sp.]|nr:hypothetical protein [Polaribacter sp.]